MTKPGDSQTKNINYTYDLKKYYTKEERILNLILQRAWAVNRRMGSESAFEDMLSYLKKWKKENHGWQKKSYEKLCELQITINEGKLNGH